ncbi:MAG: hypothetical protein IJD59_04120, partial [Clostridia bacterium]|nr:hypothetical protein [Clostridia bacterium]
NEALNAELTAIKASEADSIAALAAERAKNETLTAENEALNAELTAIKASEADSTAALAAERAKNETLTAENEALNAELTAIKASEADSIAALTAERAKNETLASVHETVSAELAATKAALAEAQEQSLRNAKLEAALAQKTAEILALQAETEKLRADLIYQDRSERVAYAHTNTFFIMEEKMGRFYRDAMCFSEEKTGI